MSVTLQADEWEDIYWPLYGYFGNLVGDDGANSLNDVYELGIPAKPGDELIWELSGKPASDIPTFTYDEIDKLERDIHLVKNNDYPVDVKKAVSDLLDLLKNEQKARLTKAINAKAKNAAVREVYETATNMNATPGYGPANRIRNFLGVKPPFFGTENALKRAKNALKRAEGGKRSRKARKTRKARKAKKTRKH
jgi:hypothetical protein